MQRTVRAHRVKALATTIFVHRFQGIRLAMLVSLATQSILAASATAAPPDVRFVRGGVIIEGGDEVRIAPVGEPLASQSQRLDGSRQLIEFKWSPQTEYEFSTADSPSWSLRSPLRPAPYEVRHVVLERVDEAAQQDGGPDTVVRFAPDSRRLAIGSFGGWLRIVDCYGGAMLHSRRVPEGMVKQLAWSPDGARLYVGQQSPDGQLAALDARAQDSREAASFREVWSLRLADDLESSRLPAGDRYGIYTLPAVTDMKVARDGRLFVAGNHNWTVDNVYRSRSMLYCLDPAGEVLWRFPPEGASSLTITHLAIDREGDKFVFMPSRSPAASEEGDLEAGTLYQLDGRTGRLSAEFRIEPLSPYFDTVQSWDSVTLSDDGRRAAVGLADGRVLLFDSTADSLRLINEFELATPIVVGQVPLGAPASYTRFLGEQLFMQTQNTYVPFGSTQAAHQAPSAHRGANMLTVADADGTIQWRYRGPFALNGNWSDRNDGGRGRRWLLTACREPTHGSERGQFGLLLFDLARPGAGYEKLVYYYPTVGPAGFDADLSPDGRLAAIVETPSRTPDQLEVIGRYQVHVVH